MKKKKITLPKKINYPILIKLLQSKTGVIATNWLTQAMRHMSPSERLHRLSLEILCILSLFYFLKISLPFWYSLLIASVSIHSLFFVFNGQIYTLKRYLSDNLITRTNFISYIEKMHPTLKNHSCLHAVIAFGSLSKGSVSLSSDFDVRLIRKSGFLNAFRAANLCARERYRAFFGKFPIDIIVCKIDELVLANDEPIIILDGSEHIFKDHPAGIEDFTTLLNRLK